MSWPGRVIGRQGALPWKLPEDLQRFKALTMSHPILMGRRTWASLGRPLPGRSNIVLSRSPFKAEGALAVGSLDAALELARGCPGGESIFVIGGAELYAQALPRAEALHLTLIHHDLQGDAFFPPLDLGDWWEKARTKQRHEGDPSFDFDYVDLQRP